jgi:uncharacterized protein (TIGR03437 family)
VRNAATDIYGDTVTACSIVTITGIHLAAASESVGSRLPRQMLAGTSVRMGDSLLPLFAVSPAEISAQLPCDLPDGPNTLVVHSGNEPDASTDFTVARNAPGLFTRSVDGQSFALAAHADGTAVSPASPVVDGEIVSVFGTGFGPLVTPALQGIAAPAAPEFSVADAVQAFLGSHSLTPSYAGAAGSQPGLDMIQVQFSANGSTAFKVRVNGQESNVVTLPVSR